MKKQEKIRKYIIIGVILIAIIIVGSIYLPKLANKNKTVSTTNVTYNVQEITYGNVSTTISGSGNITPLKSKTYTVKYPDSEVTKIYYQAGDTVSKGKTIMKITSDFGTQYVKAPYKCVIINVNVTKGSSVNMGESLVTVMGTTGFYMSLNVDELNILNVKKGQSAKITISALDEELDGSVYSISYSGTTSGSTTKYAVKLKIPYVENAYPNMSADSELIIEDSGDGLLVPAEAVYTQGDTKYIYLAPEGSSFGDKFEQDELELSTLTKVEVKTGMSDGTYIMIESDQLKEGDLFILKKTTSTATGSSSSSEQTFDFGNMPGGPSNMGDFDPNNMPTPGENKPDRQGDPTQGN